MDPSSLVVGATIALVGAVLGRLSRRTPQPQATVPSGPACSCSHGYGTHEDGKSCRGSSLRKHYDKDGFRFGWEWVQCPCVHYDGVPPLPNLDEVWGIPQPSQLPKGRHDNQ